VLTLQINPERLGKGHSPAWRWNGTSYVTSDGSRVTPFAHQMVEQAAATDGTRTAIIVRERVPRRPGAAPAPVAVTPRELDMITAQARRWPVDHLLIETAGLRFDRHPCGSPVA
jgi:hypothetical protein